MITTDVGQARSCERIRWPDAEPERHHGRVAFWIFVAVVVDVLAFAFMWTSRCHRRAHEVAADVPRVDPVRSDHADPSEQEDETSDRTRARAGVDARNAALLTVWQSPALWG
jgi:hypothetical protein